MKVKELIEQLSKMDQEADVWLYDGDWTEHPCSNVTPWLEQVEWPPTVNNEGEVVMRTFETPRVLLE